MVIFQCRNGIYKKKQMEMLELKNTIMLVKEIHQWNSQWIRHNRKKRGSVNLKLVYKLSQWRGVKN